MQYISATNNEKIQNRDSYGSYRYRFENENTLSVLIRIPNHNEESSPSQLFFFFSFQGKWNSRPFELSGQQCHNNRASSTDLGIFAVRSCIQYIGSRKVEFNNSKKVFRIFWKERLMYGMFYFSINYTGI